jgi:hypothetical protein
MLPVPTIAVVAKRSPASGSVEVVAAVDAIVSMRLDTRPKRSSATAIGRRTTRVSLPPWQPV